MATLLVVLSGVIAKPAHASTGKTALVLANSVSTWHYGNGLSDEEIQAQAQGFTTTRVSAAQWDAMSAAQFAQYQVLIIGDPTCAGSYNYQAAINNANVWEPVVMSSGGNRVLIGTDPVYHLHAGHPGALTLINHGIGYAGAVSGSTGIYWDLSCEGGFGPLPYLDGLTTKGPGHWAQHWAPCTGSISIVAQSGPTAGLHDSDLSNWFCSVHEVFTSWPSDFTVLAMATDPSVPHTYAATDVDTGAAVAGSPYIMVGGAGIKIVSNVTLTPATGSDPAGTTHTVTATVVKGGTPEANKTVSFSVDSGPNTGATGSGVTNASGQTSWTYTSNGVVGTDTISASFTDDAGLIEKTTATETWTLAIVTTKTTYTGATSGDWSDSVKLSAKLTNSATSAGIAGKTLTLTLGSQSCSAGPTDASGAASCNLTLTQTPGTYPVTAAFAGDAGDTASSDSGSFTIKADETSLANTGATAGAYNDGSTFTATLSDPNGGAPVAGQSVTFTLGGQSCTGNTAADGSAGCELLLNQAPGSYTLAISFAGSTYYAASSTAVPFTINREDTAVASTGATSGEYNDSVAFSGTLTDPDGGAPIAGKTVTFTLGSQSCSGLTAADGSAGCSVVLNQAPGSYTLSVSFAGDAYYLPSASGSAFTINQEDTAVTLLAASATTGDYHDPVTFAASLTDPTDGIGIGGKTITFAAGSDGCSATTDAGGIASCSLVLSQAAGSYTVSASFAGDAYFLASSAAEGFTITREQTTLSYTGDTVIPNGGTAHMSGTLLEDGTTAIAGRTVTFTLGSGATAQTCTGVTDASGQASCSISGVNQPLGPNTAGDSFAGDAYYLPASASAAVLSFAFANGGSFVIGDRTPAAINSTVEFWGAKWAKDNSLSGGAAPRAFKGFEDSSALPACGGSFVTDPGNSSAPPASLPSYMGVVVSSHVGKSGSAISGDVVRIVVVTTNGGYLNDPGHPGTGTVVANYC